RQGILSRIRLLESVELALQQPCGHEMAVPPCQVFGEEVAATTQIDQPYFRPIADDDFAIGPLESGAGDDAWLLPGALMVDPIRHACEPRPAVRIGQRNAGMHLGDVRCWME